MAEDPNIILGAQQANVAPIINNAAQTDQANALAAEQTLKAHYENLGERDKQRLQSTITGAAQLKTYLDQGDVEGAHQFLVQRQQALQGRMANGENVDTQETDYALDKLRKGDIQGLQNDVNSMMAAGQAYGMLGREGTPSNVQEWQYYNSLKPEDQSRYLTMKRSNQVVDLGGTKIVPNQAAPAGAPNATYNVTLKPEDQPTNAGAKAAAIKVGEATGAVDNPQVNKARTQVSGILNDVRKNYQDLNTKGGMVDTNKSASSNIAASLGASNAGQFVGKKVGTEEQSIRNKINNQIPALINSIRQATGMSAKAMDSNAELQFYLQQASNPQLDIQANLSALDMLEKLYGASSSPKVTSATPTQSNTPTAPANGMVKVSNGQESYMISPADLPQAQAEGFQQVQ